MVHKIFRSQATGSHNDHSQIIADNMLEYAPFGFSYALMYTLKQNQDHMLYNYYLTDFCTY